MITCDSTGSARLIPKAFYKKCIFNAKQNYVIELFDFHMEIELSDSSNIFCLVPFFVIGIKYLILPDSVLSG